MIGLGVIFNPNFIYSVTFNNIDSVIGFPLLRMFLKGSALCIWLFGFGMNPTLLFLDHTDLSCCWFDLVGLIVMFVVGILICCLCHIESKLEFHVIRISYIIISSIYIESPCVDFFSQ